MARINVNQASLFDPVDDSQAEVEITPTTTPIVVPRADRASGFTLQDQIRRDLETLRMTHIPFPGREFFEERIAAYRKAATSSGA